MKEGLDEQIEDAYRYGGDALGLMYRAYSIRLFRFCRSKGLAEADAEDVCHDVLLKAHHAMNRFRSGSAMWPWLAKIAANTITDLHRRQGRSIPTALIPETRPDEIREEADRKESSELVLTAMRRLPKHYASLIYLREYEDRPYAEIGSALGLSVASVRTGLLRARRVLRKEIIRLQEEVQMVAWVILGWGRLRSWAKRLNESTRISEPQLLQLVVSVVLLSYPLAIGDRIPDPTRATVPMSTALSTGLGASSLLPGAAPVDSDGRHLAARDRGAPSDGRNWFHTPRLSASPPMHDPTDESEVGVRIGPIEIWCPYFRSAPVVEAGCSEVANLDGDP